MPSSNCPQLAEMHCHIRYVMAQRNRCFVFSSQELEICPVAHAVQCENLSCKLTGHLQPLQHLLHTSHVKEEPLRVFFCVRLALSATDQHKLADQTTCLPAC